MRFSKILINRSNNFSLILLSDIEGSAGLIPDSKGSFEAQANIQTIHNAKNQNTLMQDIIHKTIIHASQKIVSDLPINTVQMEKIVATITFWNKKREIQLW